MAKEPVPKQKVTLLGRFGLSFGLVLVIGLVAGLGFASKATDQRRFCRSCHIMEDWAWSNAISTHANIACNECHAPYGLIQKLPFKAVAGTSDAIKNMGKPADVVHASPKIADVVKENCIRCHVMTNVNVASMNVKPYCTDCHRSAHHLRMLPISKRKVGDG